MTQRVLLGQLPDGDYGLRVSRPGANVASASLSGKQLAFDSRWSASSRLFRQGAVNVAAGGLQTVNFGKTFANPPVVIAKFRWTNATVWIAVGQSDSTINYESNPTVTQVNAGLAVFIDNPMMRVYRDRIEFRGVYSVGLRVVYIILDE